MASCCLRYRGLQRWPLSRSRYRAESERVRQAVNIFPLPFADRPNGWMVMGDLSQFWTSAPSLVKQLCTLARAYRFCPLAASFLLLPGRPSSQPIEGQSTTDGRTDGRAKRESRCNKMWRGNRAHADRQSLAVTAQLPSKRNI